MKQPIGIGELAGVFARAFLRCGYPVYPITRDKNSGVNLNNRIILTCPHLITLTIEDGLWRTWNDA